MDARSLKQRIRAGELLAGTFIKTTSHQIVEIMGASGLDFLVVDAEHAPFDRTTLDLAAMALRTTDMPAIVRIAASAPREVLDVLDLGFDGVLAPHALTRAGIDQVAKASRYIGGLRGFSNSPRAGRYGATGMAQHLQRSDADAVVICQIEDISAVHALPELVAVSEVDAFLIGRADLAVSCGQVDIQHPEVRAAVDQTIRACVAAGKTVGIFVGHPDEIPAWAEAGVRLFIVGSDQAMLRAQAAYVAARVAAARQATAPQPALA